MQFSAWEMTNGDVIFDDIYSNETAVDFRASNSKVKANYEPLTRHLASETDPLIRNNGDRVMVYGKETHPLDIPQDPGHPVYDGNRYFMAYQRRQQLYSEHLPRIAETWTVDTASAAKITT
jgi:hypothetical protein